MTEPFVAFRGYRYIRLAGVLADGKVVEQWLEGSHDQKEWVRIDQPDADPATVVEVPTR